MIFRRYVLPCFVLLLVGCGDDLLGGGASLGGSGKPSDSINTGVPNSSNPDLIADNRTPQNSIITYSSPIVYECAGIKQQLQFMDASGKAISTATSLPFSSSVTVILLIDNTTEATFAQQFERCHAPFRLLDARDQPLLADQVYQCEVGTPATLLLEPRELQQHRYQLKTPNASGNYFIEYTSHILSVLSERPESAAQKKLDALSCQQPLRLSFTVANAATPVTAE